MTVLAPEAAESGAGRRAPSRRPLIAGSAAGLWALLVGVTLVTCVVLAAWTLAPNAQGDGAAAWRAAGILWLAAHLVPIGVGSGEVSLLPAGALLLGLLLNRRGGKWAGRLLFQPSPAEMLGIVIGGALTYGAGAAAVAWLSDGGSAGGGPVDALARAALVAAAGMIWGMAPETGLGGGIRARISDAAWRTIVAGVTAVGGLLAVGFALVMLGLVFGGRQAATTLGELDAGLVGSLLLTVCAVLCLPTLAVWAMSVVVGPGFDFGALGGLDITGGSVSGLPALPVLAAIPSGLPAWTRGLLLIPVLMGVAAGRIRWQRDLPTASGALTCAGGLVAVVAVLVGGLVLLASGSLGGGRLAQVGPSILAVPAAAAGLVGLGFLAEAGHQSLRLNWDLYLAAQRAEEGRDAPASDAGSESLVAGSAGDVPPAQAEALEGPSGDSGDVESGPAEPSPPVPDDSDTGPIVVVRSGGEDSAEDESTHDKPAHDESTGEAAVPDLAAHEAAADPADPRPDPVVPDAPGS
ncbi:MAG: DUF6350 family protein [Candidatus Nanopelagicales bacterium]